MMIKTPSTSKKAKPVITSKEIKAATEKINKSREELEGKINPPSSTSKKLKEYKPSPVLNGLMKQAFSELKKVEGSYLKIAFAIYRIHSEQLYTELGCNDIYSFVKKNFGLSRGTCHNFLTIVNTFGKRDAKGMLLSELVDEAKGYKSTQLIIMSGMNTEQLAECKPEMTCAQLKRILNGPAAIPESSCNLNGKVNTETVIDTDGDNENDNVVDSTAKEVNHQTLITCIDLQDYEGKVDKIDSLIRRAFKNETRKIKIEIAYTWED